jgi:hypothetical protein
MWRPSDANLGAPKDFRDMLVVVRENVATLKRQGRSREATVAAKPTASFDAKWGNSSWIPAISPGRCTRAYERVRRAGVNGRIAAASLRAAPGAGRDQEWVQAGERAYSSGSVVNSSG